MCKELRDSYDLLIIVNSYCHNLPHMATNPAPPIFYLHTRRVQTGLTLVAEAKQIISPVRNMREKAEKSPILVFRYQL